MNTRKKTRDSATSKSDYGSPKKSATSSDSDVPEDTSFSRLLPIAIRDRERDSQKLYNELCSRLKEKCMTDEEFLDIVNGIKSCSHLLDKSHQGLILTFFEHDLSCRSVEILDQLRDMVVELVSAQTYTTKLFINVLLINLRNVSCSDNTDPSVSMRFKYLHYILNALLKAVPTSRKLVFEACQTHLPYMSKPIDTISWYIDSLLAITKYAPDLSQPLLDLTVDYLLKIDVSVSREALIKLRDEAKDHEIQFDMDISSSDITSFHNDKTSDLAMKLDRLMIILLGYVKELCYGQTEHLDTRTTRDVFTKLERTFSSVILATSCSHVQYVMFYIISFDPALTDRFLQLCWRHIQDPTVPVILSQISCSYLGGLLTRAKFITLKQVKQWLGALVEYAHKYIDSQDSDISLIPSKHKLVYQLCQTVFYISVSHHTEIAMEPDGMSFLQQLNFERIVMSRLNPLKFCLSSIADLFARMARFHQIAFCYTVIERNNRASIRNKVVQMSKKDIEVRSYFPFDPYLLPKSVALIEPLYRHWGAVYRETSSTFTAEEDHLMDDIVKSFENSFDLRFPNRFSLSDMDVSMTPVHDIDVK